MLELYRGILVAGRMCYWLAQSTQPDSVSMDCCIAPSSNSRLRIFSLLLVGGPSSPQSVDRGGAGI